jgi:His/Glu/Gln/Arg/opine family amino acid ABC transporter permease subunit
MHCARAWLILFACLASLVRPVRASAAPLVVGVSGQFPPFSYTDSAGRLVGFDVAYARALCDELARPCDFRVLPWDSLIAAVRAGRVDAVISSVAITEEREKAVRFSRPYYRSGAQLFVADGGAPEAPSRIGVTVGTTYERIARNRFPRAEIRSFKSDVDALNDLAARRIDAVVTDRFVGLHAIRVAELPITIAGEVLEQERMGIAVAPSSADLLRAIDHAIDRLEARGVDRELLMREVEHRRTPGAGTSGARLMRALPSMLRGLTVTLRVCAAGIGLASFLGVLAAHAMTSSAAWSRSVERAVDVVRATPFMVQLFALYFGLPSVGIALSGFTSGVLAMGVHGGAYVGEILRAAYGAVPVQQRDAAYVLGLSRLETLRFVVAPQMVPIAAAPTAGLAVALVKDSAIVSVVGVHELMLESQRIVSGSFRPLETYALAALAYGVVTYPLVKLARRLEANATTRARGT